MARTINMGNDPYTIMGILQNIFAVGSNLAALTPSGTGKERMYVKQKSQVYAGLLPVIELDVLDLTARTAGSKLFNADYVISAKYYDAWHTQTSPSETIEQAMYQDLMRCLSNIEANNSLVYSGVNHALKVDYQIKNTPEYTEELPGMPKTLFIEAWLMFYILPYDVM